MEIFNLCTMCRIRSRIGPLTASGILAFCVTFAAVPAWAQQKGCATGTFPSYLDEQPGKKPPGYTGPVFSLSQNYPQTLPPKAAYPWLKVPVPNGRISDPKAYVMAVKQYVLEGNTDTDFVFQNNKVRPWFHLPWMHASPIGREFIHGLTHEKDSAPGVLDTTNQKNWSGTWAVSGINDRGAYGVGQVWCDPAKPNPLALNPNPNEANFMPDGSAQVKLLFATASITEVPWLKNSLEWRADMNQLSNPLTMCAPATNACPGQMTCNLGVCFAARKISSARLLQMDIAVRDDRISGTGWAFGTFAYNVNAPGVTVWDRMIPIGLQWGLDPGITAEMVKQRGSGLIRESWINQAADPLKPNGIFAGGNHLGYAGRLNGPADDPASACMSCHLNAGLIPPIAPGIVPGALPIVPAAAPGPMTTERMLTWFLNIPAGVAANSELTSSLDYSLQLTLGIQRFYTSQATTDAQRKTLHMVTRGSEVFQKK